MIKKSKKVKILYSFFLITFSFSITTEDIYDNSYALIIGIDKYQNVRGLDYAVKDAVDIQTMLIDIFHFKQDNIVLLQNEEATKTNIIQEFSNITKEAGVNDRLLIFFAGHGETETLPNGGEIGYLMPVDGNQDLYVSAIKMDELRTISLRSEAKHILYLVDACYGGLVSVGARSLDAQTEPDYISKITKEKSRQIISAGGRGEEVIEKAEWGHSAFTKNILSGLRDAKADTDSDGIITAQELGIYLKKRVTIDSNNQQTPKTRNLTTDEGEFVFIYSENIIINQQADNNADDEKMDLILDKLDKLEKQTEEKTTINEDEEENGDDEEDDWNDEDLLFHILFYESYNNNTSMPGTSRGTMGLSKAIDPNLDLQVGIMFDSNDEFENDSLEYNSIGLRVGINKNIYKNIMSTQAAIGIIRSTYKNEEKEILIDNSIGFLIEISMGVIFPYWEEMSIQFLTGYNFNGIKNQDDEDLLNSPFVGIGIQILGDWF
jgi:hypothetical protein